jgi:hypothetical protein
MTDEEINEQIEEVTGWFVRPLCEGPQNPNFCQDLNAMFVLEQRLTPDQFVEYVWEVMHICHEPMLATARQRAEAYLRMIEAWEKKKK